MVAQTWLTLGEASRRLGVHPNTLRSWADRGEVSVYRTPGGHRRFLADDIKALLRPSVEALALPAPLESQEYLAYITHVRHDLSQLPMAREAWLAAFHEGERQTWRESGRRLLGLAIQYAARQQARDHIAAEARAIGVRYGESCAQHHIRLPDLFRACLFFYDAVLGAASPGAPAPGLQDVEGLRIGRDLSVFLGEVVCAIAEGYDAFSAGPAGRAT